MQIKLLTQIILLRPLVLPSQVLKNKEQLLLEIKILKIKNERNKDNASRENLSDNKLKRQNGVYYSLRSNEIIRNIHTVKRGKRIQEDKFYKVKSWDDIISSPLKHLRSEINNKVQYNWDIGNQFFSNPIEILRQERLRREKMRQQRIQKEKDKLKELDHEDIRYTSRIISLTLV